MTETRFERSTRKLKSFLFPKQESESPYLSGAPFTPEHLLRRRIYAERWRYFLGRHDPPLKLSEEGVDHNVIVSITTKIVNDSVNFLFGPGVEFEVAPDESKESSLNQTLADFWLPKPEFNWNPGEFYLDLGQVGAITGTPILRMYLIGDDQRPELVVLDPGLVEITTSQHNYREVVEYKVFWQEKGDEWHRHRITKSSSEDELEPAWAIIEERYLGQDEWEAVSGSLEAWDHPFAPIFVGKNLPLAHSVYGLSDIEHAGLNDAINRNTSDVNKILHYHAHPATFLIGVTPNQVRTNLLQTGAGTLIPIPNEQATVKTMQLEGDLVASREYIKMVRGFYDDVAGNVSLDPHRIGLGAMSGFALRILYRPILEKTRVKRLTYGALLSQVNRAILILKGASDPIRMVAHWADPLPSNQEEQARIASLLSAVYTAEGSALAASYDASEIDALMHGEILKSQKFFTDPVTNRPINR